MEKGLVRDAIVQIGSGGTAGFVEVCIMHPLDLIKTRLQIQKTPVDPKDPFAYTGVIDCFRKMYRQEGVLAFYKGILPPLFAETPKRALKFFTFEQYKQIFRFGADKPTPTTYILAGFCAGVTEAVFVNPFEMVKVTMQSNKSKAKESPSTWQVLKEIVKKDGIGLGGLNKGLTATMCRNGVFNCFYFGFYNSIKDFAPPTKDPIADFFKRCTLGFCAGSGASIMNIPFDVAKSRIQGPPVIVDGQLKYRSTFKTVYLIYKEEGFTALYKGLVPKVMRLGPGGAIMMIVYEHMYDFLSRTV